MRRVGVWGRVCTTLGHAPRGETPSPPSQPVPLPPRLDELLEGSVAGKEGLGLCQGGSQVGAPEVRRLSEVWSGIALQPGVG